jgi:hypothetical protein
MSACTVLTPSTNVRVKRGDEPGDHGWCNKAGNAQRGGYVNVDDGS